jgi:predicted DNA-binding mobile mystery protein A
MKNQALLCKQLDRQLEDWQKLKFRERPAHGWVQTIRKALGMTGQQLAKRAGLHRMRIIQLERAESADAVTLRSLRAIAKNLGCELVYTLVPQIPLQTMLEQQALKIAKRRVEQVAHSMSLENQAVSDAQLQEQIEELTKKLLEGPPKHLWSEEQ